MAFTCEDDLIQLVGNSVRSVHATIDLLCIGLYKLNRYNGWDKESYVLCTYSGDFINGLNNLYIDDITEMVGVCSILDQSSMLDRLCWVAIEEIITVIPRIKDKRWLSRQLIKQYQ